MIKISEAELQKQIIREIKSKSLISIIVNKESYININDDWKNENFQPYFTINYLLRRKYIESTKYILESLDDELIIVNGESIKNVSLNKSERLYPDVVLYSEQSSKYFIMELKRSRESERQAITELLGYHLEFKNHLPFSNKYNMPFIIVSTEYNTLLLHSVATLLLEDIPVLCLVPNFDGDNFINFDILNLEAWSNLENNEIDFDALSGYSVCLYGASEDAIEEEEVIEDIVQAIDYLKVDGNRMGSHGFCVAVVDYDANGIDSPISTDYKIGVFTINPYSIYHKSSYQSSNDTLSKFIDECIESSDVVYHSTTEDNVLLKGMYNLLDDKYRPCIEGLMNFNQFIDYLPQNGYPIICDAWGEVGEFIRKLYVHPYIKKSAIKRGDLGYKNPAIFFRLLSYMTRRYTFAKGFNRGGEYLKFGYQFGEIINLCQNLEIDESNRLKNELFQKFLEISNSLQDIGEKSEDSKPNILSIDLENINQLICDLTKYHEWFALQLAENSIEQYAFLFGVEYYAFFTKENILETAYGKQLYEGFIKNVYGLFEDVLVECLKYCPTEVIKSDLSMLCYEIAMELDEYELSTAEDFINLARNENTITRLRAIEREKKIALVKNNLYQLLQVKKVLGISQMDTSIDQLIANSVKQVDINWLISEVNRTTASERKCLTITEEGEVIVELIKDETAINSLSYTDSSFILKVNRGISEMYLPFTVEELRDMITKNED